MTGKRRLSPRTCSRGSCALLRFSTVKDADVLDQFDRVVFESLVEKVIVGEQAEDGTVDPYKLTFVLKGMDERSIPDARDRYMNLHNKAV